MRPVLEYGSSVWDLHTHGLHEDLEKVQNRAARFVTGNCDFETGSMTGIHKLGKPFSVRFRLNFRGQRRPGLYNNII